MEQIEKTEEQTETTKIEEQPSVSDIEVLRAEINDIKDKYLRLYAEFDNYKKKVQKDKEELIKYSNETFIHELLPVIDHLEMALKHSAQGDVQSFQALVKGVENTLREFSRTLEKFGVKAIDVLNKPFNPEYHHAMSHVEREDVEENVVVEEFRKGYLYREKVLRPSLVAVSKKNSRQQTADEKE